MYVGLHVKRGCYCVSILTEDGFSRKSSVNGKICHFTITFQLEPICSMRANGWTDRRGKANTSRSPFIKFRFARLRLTQLENLHDSPNLHDNFLFNAIWHKRSQAALVLKASRK